MSERQLDHMTIVFALFPAVIPAAVYLLLEQLPPAYAAWLTAFLVTPVVCGGLAGARHPKLPAGRYWIAALTYATASVLISEVAEGLIPLLSYNLVNLPVYMIVATLLFGGAAVLTRATRRARHDRRALV